MSDLGIAEVQRLLFDLSRGQFPSTYEPVDLPLQPRPTGTLLVKRARVVAALFNPDYTANVADRLVWHKALTDAENPDALLRELEAARAFACAANPDRGAGAPPAPAEVPGPPDSGGARNGHSSWRTL